MIELVVKLLSGSVYLAGETVECCVEFNHIIQPEHKISQSHSDILENLAWASAQIHCFYATTKAIPEKRPHKDVGTSLELTAGDVGDVVAQTKPKILFCDLSIPLGESKKFFYKETLPIEAPPSYRGIGVKYSYKVIIATQKVNSKIKMVRIPIRVLPIMPIINLQDVAMLYNNETSEDLLPANPFLEEQKIGSPVTTALQILQNLTARRCPNSYMITNAHGKVARFCIFKSAYKLGEDIVGTFDFSIATVVCMQVSVSLQPEEVLKSETKTNTDSKRAVTVARHHEMTAGLIQTQLILPIPLHITPAFESDKVELKWRLHFEFVTTKENILTCNGNEWSAPLNVPIETMVWNLPIKIYPTLPKHISQHTSTNEVSRLLIT